ncbi:MAG: hypothetical protein KC996_08665, partial [Phycisphaerales bacterium]|nr:hypothetical protein [Phycisphaerales bacterium]
MNSLLDELGRLDREASPIGLEAGVLDAVGRAMAPAPITLVQPTPRRFPAIARFSLAAALLCAASVSVVMLRPSVSVPTAGLSGRGEMLAVSLEADVESLLALDQIEHELEQSVAAWSLRAQAVDSDLNSAWVALDLMDSSVDENGAL